tara:strand:+ start:1287 stop:2348 length:1062 start_codon:yes stop_codon:yes gene_type:complete
MFTTRRIATMGGDKFKDELSVAFDGSDDYVEISGVPSFNYNVNSISIWVNPAAESGSMSLFDYRDANNDGVHVFLGDGDVTYQIDNTDGHYDTKLPLNQWSHIVCTNDGSTSTIYVNGVSVETADTSGETINVSGSAVIRIGARSHTSTNNFFQGNISEVAIYDKALSASEANTLYNGREPYNHKEGVCSSNLQAWWRMGDSAIYPAPVVQDETNTNLGANKVTDGGFPNGDNWTVNTGWAVSSGVATCSSGFASLEQDVSAVAGEIYRVEFQASSWTEGVLVIAVGGHILTETSVTNGYHVKFFQATDTTNLKFYSVVGAQFRGSIDNVSVKKINGNPGYLYSGAEIVGGSP